MQEIRKHNGHAVLHAEDACASVSSRQDQQQHSKPAQGKKNSLQPSCSLQGIFFRQRMGVSFLYYDTNACI